MIKTLEIKHQKTFSSCEKTSEQLTELFIYILFRQEEDPDDHKDLKGNRPLEKRQSCWHY